MPKYYIAANYVPTDALEMIVSGKYEMQLSAEESALVERLPLDFKPWFERVVVNEFYLPLKGIMKPPLDMLAQLIDETLPLEAIQGQSNGDGKRNWQTLREQFVRRKMQGRYGRRVLPQGNATFEEIAEKVFREYKADLIGAVRHSLVEQNSFKYISGSELRRSLTSRLSL